MERNEKATTIGREHGESAAGWWLQESPIGGRSSARNSEAREWAEKFLAKMADGDPAVYDSFPNPDLGGEWADSYTERDLCSDCDVENPDDYDFDTPEEEEKAREEYACEASELCDSYYEGFHAGAQEEIERAVREFLASEVSE